MSKDFILPIEMQSIDSSTLNPAAWTEVGNPIEGALFMVRLTNASGEDVFLSYDGINEHEYIVSGDSLPLYFQHGTRPDSDESLLAKNTVFYIKGTAGVGYIYISGYYNG